MIGYYNYTVVLTYVGMVIGLNGISFASKGNIKVAIICLMLSGLCDMFDGKIASNRVRNRTEKRFGIQIDSLSDLICFGVLPFVIVISTNQSRFVLVVGALYVLSALIRLAFFNVDEEERQEIGGERSIYLGLPVTTAAIIFPLSLFFGKYGGIVALALMSVAFLLPINFRKPHLTGKVLLISLGAIELLLAVGGKMV